MLGQAMIEGADDLPDDLALLEAMILAERARAPRLEHLLDVIKRMHFGKRSEKMSADQLALALEDSDVALAETELLTDQEDTAIGVSAERRRRRADAPRPSLPLHLPRHEIEIAPEASCCAGCGGITAS